MRRHGCSRTVSASHSTREGGRGWRYPEKLAWGTDCDPTRQWGSGKERPLPAALLLLRSTAWFARLRLIRRGTGNRTLARVGAGLLPGGDAPERVAEPIGAFGGCWGSPSGREPGAEPREAGREYKVKRRGRANPELVAKRVAAWRVSLATKRIGAGWISRRPLLFTRFAICSLPGALLLDAAVWKPSSYTGQRRFSCFLSPIVQKVPI